MNSMLNSGMGNDFKKFYNDFVKNGKNPERELTEYIQKNNISEKQLKDIISKAQKFKWLLKFIK